MTKEEAKKDILNRLKTIKGHIGGIEKMVEEDNKSCEDILVQIAAIRSSVHRVGLLIIEKYADDCLIKDCDGEISRQDLEKVLRTIVKFAK